MKATLKKFMIALLTVAALAASGPVTRADEGSVLDRLAQTVGTFKEGMIFNTQKMQVGTYKGGEIYNSKMELAGTYKGGTIYDSKGDRVGTYEKGSVYARLVGGERGELLGMYDERTIITPREGGVPAAAYLLLLRYRAVKK